MLNRWLVAGLLAGALTATAGSDVSFGASAPAPYSLPWSLRPAGAGNVIRVDQTLAWYRPAGAGEDGHTWISVLTGSCKVSPRLALTGRAALVAHRPPLGAADATVPANLLLGAAYAPPAKSAWRSAGTLLLALPVGGGGGDLPDSAKANAMSAATAARLAMDNALFAVNYLTVIGGYDLAYVRSGYTVQAEATLLHLRRARGPLTQDARRTNLTAGLHAGYAATKTLGLSAEFRYQRWLSDAAPVRKRAEARDTAALGVGARFNLKLAGGRWIRPGLAVSQILDAPSADLDYRTVQVDVPLSF